MRCTGSDSVTQAISGMAPPHSGQIKRVYASLCSEEKRRIDQFVDTMTERVAEKGLADRIFGVAQYITRSSGFFGLKTAVQLKLLVSLTWILSATS